MDTNQVVGWTVPAISQSGAESNWLRKVLIKSGVASYPGRYPYLSR